MEVRNIISSCGQWVQLHHPNRGTSPERGPNRHRPTLGWGRCGAPRRKPNPDTEIFGSRRVVSSFHQKTERWQDIPMLNPSPSGEKRGASVQNSDRLEKKRTVFRVFRSHCPVSDWPLLFPREPKRDCAQEPFGVLVTLPQDRLSLVPRQRGKND